MNYVCLVPVGPQFYTLVFSDNHERKRVISFIENNSRKTGIRQEWLHVMLSADTMLEANKTLSNW